MKLLIAALIFCGMGPSKPVQASPFTATASAPVTTCTRPAGYKDRDREIIKHMDMLKHLGMYEDLNLYRYLDVFEQEGK